MTRLASTLASLSAAFVLAGLAVPAFAQPADLGCASPIDDLGALVSELDGVLGSTGPASGAGAAYGALGGFLDQKTVAANVAALSADQRRALAGKLLLDIQSLVTDVAGKSNAHRKLDPSSRS